LRSPLTTSGTCPASRRCCWLRGAGIRPQPRTRNVVPVARRRPALAGGVTVNPMDSELTRIIASMKDARPTDGEPVPRREWLVTNGPGGYASSTVAGVVTRRYHALLVASLPARLGRVVMRYHLLERVVMPNCVLM